MPTQQRNVEPPRLSSGQGGKLGIQIGRRGEDRAGDVVFLAAVNKVRKFFVAERNLSRFRGLKRLEQSPVSVGRPLGVASEKLF
ncbi:MAG: hypothetical protein L0Z07_10080 [Planctomycetes bacterium]|nr:hypothetical protein [Planctomycetota bacterium]